MKTIKCYRFVTDNLESDHGDVQWVVGEWQKHEGELGLCQSGLHASEKPLDSLWYIYGTRWFVSEARGEVLRDTDKLCASEMRLVREIPIQVLRQWAVDCAQRVLHIYEGEYPNDKRPREAIEASQAYLDNPTKKNRSRLDAAWAAAGDAGAAAWAAWDAARAAGAARAAAGDAAWAAGAAAWAARAAAGNAERKWQNRHLSHLIRKALEVE